MGAGVADHDPGQVNFEQVAVVLVVVVDLLGQGGHVNPRVALAREVHLVLPHHRELAVELQNRLQVVLRSALVTVLVASDREPNRAGALDKQQVGLLVPAVRVQHRRGGVLGEDEGAQLGGHSQQGRAPRPSVVPDDDGVGVRVVLGGEEDVVVVLAFADGEVS